MSEHNLTNLFSLPSISEIPWPSHGHLFVSISHPVSPSITLGPPSSSPSGPFSRTRLCFDQPSITLSSPFHLPSISFPSPSTTLRLLLVHPSKTPNIDRQFLIYIGKGTERISDDPVSFGFVELYVCLLGLVSSRWIRFFPG